MYRRTLLFLVAGLVSLTGYSQSASLKTITTDEIKEHIRYLSSDSLQGRKTGSEGNLKAAAYIASEAVKLGLKPLPGQETLFQQLPFMKVTVKKDSTCIVTRDSMGKIVAKGAFMPLMVPSSRVSVTGDIVFAGYGYINSKIKYNDLKGIQISNKILIVMTRKPDFAGTGLPDKDEDVSEDIEFKKLSSLIMMNPKAILFVADPEYGKSIEDCFPEGESDKLIPLFSHSGWNFSMNVGIISAETANAILAGSGESLAGLQKRIATTKGPVSFIVPGVKADLTVAVKKDTVQSPNIVGYFEGSDSTLKKECVIYTAHYDHLGLDATGDVFNGADDNASGATGLLSVAKAFSTLNKNPSRSIVFLWTTGEEEGLFGSYYYTANPLFPLDKTVAEINFDMIGRSRMPADTGMVHGEKLDITGRDTIKLVSAHNCKEFIDISTTAGKENSLYVIDEGKGSHFGGSDHYPFVAKGIPSVFFFTGLHRDYHTETDDYQFIDFDKILKVSRTGFLTGYRIANMPVRLTIEPAIKK
jgi:hypothetical protein